MPYLCHKGRLCRHNILDVVIDRVCHHREVTYFGILFPSDVMGRKNIGKRASLFKWDFL